MLQQDNVGGNCRSQAATFSSTPAVVILDSAIQLIQLDDYLVEVSWWGFPTTTQTYTLPVHPHPLCHVYLPTNTVSSPVSSRLCWQRRWGVFVCRTEFPASWQSPFLVVAPGAKLTVFHVYQALPYSSGGSRWHSDTATDGLLLLLVRKIFLAEHWTPPSLQFCNDPQGEIPAYWLWYMITFAIYLEIYKPHLLMMLVWSPVLTVVIVCRQQQINCLCGSKENILDFFWFPPEEKFCLWEEILL